jgi:HemY protein
MFRIVLFLVLIALAAWGAAWVANQPGSVVVSWGATKATTSLPVFALLLGIVIVAAMIALGILGMLWRSPGRIRRGRHERHRARGRHAITQGLLAIGHGDAAAARRHADDARRLAGQDPLALLLHAQSAQLDGDRAGANVAFRTMAEREDTRLLGLRGLFIEAQRADDATAAAMIAQEALKISPSSTWASHAVLGFRCAQGDWDGALKIVDNDHRSGLIDKATYRRRRGVLLTARALELEKVDRDLARESAMEAVKLAPTLVPAAVLAAKFESEAHQVRRAMRIVEAAWLKHPHPDLADAYAHVRLGDSARQRLVRIETLAAKTPDAVEGKLAIARAAIDASEFSKARGALGSLTANPTQRVALLMAEIERTEHGDSGKARAWTLRAVRARLDPVWTSDGYVSDRWRPVSPVTGRLDAFQWQTPVASLSSSDHGATIDTSPFEEAMLAAPSPRKEIVASESLVEPLREIAAEVTAAGSAVQDNAPPAAKAEEKAQENEQERAQEALPEKPAEQPAEPAATAPAPAAAQPPSAAREAGSTPPAAPAPLFRTRADLNKPAPPLPVIPMVRPPDDPGIDDEAPNDEFAEQIGTPKAQAGGWRGFLSRWGR